MIVVCFSTDWLSLRALSVFLFFFFFYVKGNRKQLGKKEGILEKIS